MQPLLRRVVQLIAITLACRETHLLIFRCEAMFSPEASLSLRFTHWEDAKACTNRLGKCCRQFAASNMASQEFSFAVTDCTCSPKPDGSLLPSGTYLFAVRTAGSQSTFDAKQSTVTDVMSTTTLEMGSTVSSYMSSASSLPSISGRSTTNILSSNSGDESGFRSVDNQQRRTFLTIAGVSQETIPNNETVDSGATTSLPSSLSTVAVETVTSVLECSAQGSPAALLARLRNGNNESIRVSQMSAGGAGLWAVSQDGFTLLYKNQTYGKPNTTGQSWMPIVTPQFGKIVSVTSGAVYAYINFDSVQSIVVDATHADVTHNLAYVTSNSDAMTRSFGEHNVSSYFLLTYNGLLRIYSVPFWKPVWPPATAVLTNCGSRLWKNVAFGSSGLWALANNGSLFYLFGSRHSEATCLGVWTAVSGTFETIVTSGDGLLAVDITGILYCRRAISQFLPMGRCWQPLDLGIDIKNVSLGPTGIAWIVTEIGEIYFGELCAK